MKRRATPQRGAAARAAPVGDVIIVQPHVRMGDPHVCSDDRSRLTLLRAVYEPLVRRSVAGTLAPALASSWGVGDDGRSWWFEIRDDAEFHDGTRVTADDARRSLERVRDDPPEGELGTSGVYQGYLAETSFAVDGVRRLRVTTPAPMADLLDVLVELPVLAARDLSRSAELPPGSGPYRLVEREEAAVVLERVRGAGPRRVRAVGEADAARRAALARTGEADVVSDVAAETDLPASMLVRGPGATTTTFMFRLGDGATADVRVRRALDFAVDVDRIAARLFGGDADRVASPCTIPQLGFDPALAPYAHDPHEARRLLAEAGFGGGLALTFDVPSRLPDEAAELARLIAEDLHAVGVELTVAVHDDRDAYAMRVRSGDIADAACFDSSPLSTFRLFREKFHGGVRGVWWLGYDSAPFDALVDEATATFDVERRRALYRLAARRLHDDAPWLYLYAPRLRWARRPELATWRPTHDGLIDLGLETWEA